MTTPKIKCEICGYEGEVANEIFDGICQECAEKEYTTIKLSKMTKYYLDRHGNKSESYDHIIKRLLNGGINDNSRN